MPNAGDGEVIDIRGGLIPGPLRQATDPEETTEWEQVSPRHINAADWERFETYVSEIFGAFGMDLDTPGTRETPNRFLKAMFDATSGYEGDEKLLTAFPNESAESEYNQVVEGGISFYALCEHHALPFHGSAYLGYIPNERIIGLSKLTRLVRLFARRFTVQEWMGRSIADALFDLMEPHGVAVYLEAEHLCTQMRGVREEHSRTVTTLLAGRVRGERGSATRVPRPRSQRCPQSVVLDLLFEDEGLPSFDLPDELARLYGGSLGFPTPRLYANFVSTLDGVVAISSIPESNKIIAAGSEADRFLMGLLRAFAGVIVVGSGTLHGSPQGLWAPGGPHPPTREALFELRQRLSLPPEPEVAILTRSGSIDAGHPVFEKGALVLTTLWGKAILGAKLPAASTVVALGEDIDLAGAIAWLRERGHAARPHRGRPDGVRSHGRRRPRRRALPDRLAAPAQGVIGRTTGLQLIEEARLLPGRGSRRAAFERTKIRVTHVPALRANGADVVLDGAGARRRTRSRRPVRAPRPRPRPSRAARAG